MEHITLCRVDRRINTAEKALNHIMNDMTAAVYRNKLELCKSIKEKYDISDEEMWPYVIYHNFPNIAFGISDNNSMLIKACNHGSKEMVEWFLNMIGSVDSADSGATTEYELALSAILNYCAIKNDHELLNYVRHNRTDAMRKACTQRVSSFAPYNPLIWALCQGSTEVAAIICDLDSKHSEQILDHISIIWRANLKFNVEKYTKLFKWMHERIGLIVAHPEDYTSQGKVTPTIQYNLSMVKTFALDEIVASGKDFAAFESMIPSDTIFELGELSPEESALNLIKLNSFSEKEFADRGFDLDSTATRELFTSPKCIEEIRDKLILSSYPDVAIDLIKTFRIDYKTLFYDSKPTYLICSMLLQRGFERETCYNLILELLKLMGDELKDEMNKCPEVINICQHDPHYSKLLTPVTMME
jgi:hypothetical protein